MKNAIKLFSILVFVSIASACHNSETQNNSSGLQVATGEQTDTGALSSTTSETGSKRDTLLFIGKFAQWKKQNPIALYDGAYDADREIFKLCGNNKYIHVPDSQVLFRQGASCDTAKKELLCMMERINIDSFRALTNNFEIRIDTITHVVNGTFYVGDKAAKIPLQQQDYQRLIESDLPIKSIGHSEGSQIKIDSRAIEKYHSSTNIQGGATYHGNMLEQQQTNGPSQEQIKGTYVSPALKETKVNTKSIYMKSDTSNPKL